MKGHTQVVAGVNVKYIDNVPHVLLGLKPRGEWEFPGGKIEPNETHVGALEREWMEELGVMVEVNDSRRFGRAHNGVYEVWFYEVDIIDNDTETEPLAKEHIEVTYFKLNEAPIEEMNEVNKVMLGKLISKYE